MDLMIWRFGDFSDFCDFSDPELFRLWDKNDRILQAQRVEKRRKRMSRTAITPQESISSPATIPETITVDKFSNQVDEISAEKKESKQGVDLSMEKIASQVKLPNTKVHVSDSENLRNIETRIENSVLDNFESVVKEAKIQTNIRMDVVNDSKNVSAHQVLDKMCQLKRLKLKNKRKLRLSLKTWKFKFKHTSKKRKSLDVKFFSVEEISWLPKDPKEIYRSCVDNEFKEVVAGCGKLFDRFQTSPSYALDVVNKTSKPWETHTPFTSTHVASVNSLSFAVGTADNFELCVGHETGIMRLKLLLHSGFAGDRLTELDFHISEIHGLLVFPWNLMLLEFFLFLHLEDKVCLSAASNSCYGWMVFDRGKNIKILGDVITLKRDDQTMLMVKAKDGHVDSLIVRIKVILSCGVALRKQIQWAEIQKLSLYKEFWIEIMDGDITKLLNSTGGKHTVSAWELYLSSVFSTVTSANSGWLQGLLEQVFQGDDEAYTKIFDKLQLNLKQGMDLYRASGHRLFLRQQSSSSIWHRWRRKD